MTDNEMTVVQSSLLCKYKTTLTPNLKVTCFSVISNSFELYRSQLALLVLRPTLCLIYVIVVHSRINKVSHYVSDIYTLAQKRCSVINIFGNSRI